MPTFKGYSKEVVDARISEALIAWAAAKWPELENVTKVELDTSVDYGYSEYTPGDGAEFTVRITRRYHCRDCGWTERTVTRSQPYEPKVINDLLFFMFVGELPS